MSGSGVSALVGTAAAAPASARLLCYGDSLTAGYLSHSPASQQYSPYAHTLGAALKLPCDAVGMSGWTTRQMRVHLHTAFAEDVCGQRRPGLAVLLQRRPYSHVLLMAGTNDLGTREASDIFEDLRHLHEACHAAGAKTVALTIPQSMATVLGPRQLERTRAAVNGMLREYAERMPSMCAFVGMDQDVPWVEDTVDFEPDGLHFSQRGYSNFGQRLAPKLEPILQRPA